MNKKPPAGGYRLFFKILFVMLCTATVCWAAFFAPSAKDSFTFTQPEQTEPISSVIPIYTYPTDQLFVDSSREAYESGSLRLVVPKMGVDCVIMDGMDEETLKQGPGLYDYAQLPAYGNPNVSIAGHRDIYGAHFLTIDRITSGDLLYLVYEGTVYCYQYLETAIIQANDWTPIYCRDFSCLTLTSCDPVGTSLNRIIVTGELVSAEEYSTSFSFKETAPTVS